VIFEKLLLIVLSFLKAILCNLFVKKNVYCHPGISGMTMVF